MKIKMPTIDPETLERLSTSTRRAQELLASCGRNIERQTRLASEKATKRLVATELYRFIQMNRRSR